MARYVSFEDVNIGDKVIIDNTLGIVPNVEKTKLLAQVVEKLEDENIKVNVESSLFSEPVEAVFKYYLFI